MQPRDHCRLNLHHKAHFIPLNFSYNFSFNHDEWKVGQCDTDERKRQFYEKLDRNLNVTSHSTFHPTSCQLDGKLERNLLTDMSQSYIFANRRLMAISNCDGNWIKFICVQLSIQLFVQFCRMKSLVVWIGLKSSCSWEQSDLYNLLELICALLPCKSVFKAAWYIKQLNTAKAQIRHF